MHIRISLAGLLLPLLAACSATAPVVPRSASPAVACEGLPQSFRQAGLDILKVQPVAAGTLRLPGIAEPMPAHCVVTGRMDARRSPVDGKDYAIGFEMRLPSPWNGRFFYQANGGLDGFITPAYGNILGGGPATNGLLKGFAVLSSDAGHAFERAEPVTGAALFGRDPQARLDYGYNAVARLTPMARALAAHYYGRPVERAYLVGSSNGGRHGFVAAARDTGAYDGILATTPGWRLPLAAVTQVWGAQQFARLARSQRADGVPDLESAFTPAEMQVLSQAVLSRCDALDGLADGIVADLAACQKAFDPLRDIPACTGDAGPGCLSDSRRLALAQVFAGPGFYTGLAWDPGVRGRNWREWKFTNSIGPRDAIALAYVFVTPPAAPEALAGNPKAVAEYALRFDTLRDAARVFGRDATYTQPSWDFMVPPQATRMDFFVARGGKLLVAHGAADPVFSVLDSIRWYEDFTRNHGSAQDSARLYVVPGMNHSLGGPATDRFDMLDALVAWVEQGRTPGAIVAGARGAGDAVPNAELPADWSPQRTRLLCPWPQVPRYQGGDRESSASFACRP